ncbi:hypothetical protein PM10SUCC1_04440 [Propionigenium maris DSM 9537]|uniref:Secreted protein n=1 Tax=Propionigenium maris DSM 9537 TaxID=1123000 RepID=A0A9W6GJB6_9FUSO|nr:hypothetical protein [Propionigenium maris]GLI54929.1 hypothetical protein PM10SUCC1_04440 [Propionigenium maris DSM 9537]
MKKFLIVLGITLFIGRNFAVDFSMEPREGEQVGYMVTENSGDNTEGRDGMDMKDTEDTMPPT